MRDPMNERIRELMKQAGGHSNISKFRGHFLPPPPDYIDPATVDLEKFAESIIEEYAQEYQRLINGDSVVVPKDRAHAEAMVRMGMFYLEQAK